MGGSSRNSGNKVFIALPLGKFSKERKVDSRYHKYDSSDSSFENCSFLDCLVL